MSARATGPSAPRASAGADPGIDTTAPAVSLSLPGPARRDLETALREEAALLESLIQVLERQRRGIAEQDLAVVDETVYGSQRILLTLNEARKRRSRLLDLAAGEEGTEASVPARLGPAAEAAWRDLTDTAQRLSHTLSVNQTVLRQAIRFGEEYVRTVFGDGAVEAPAYGRDARTSAESAGGVLINRRV